MPQGRAAPMATNAAGRSGRWSGLSLLSFAGAARTRRRAGARSGAVGGGGGAPAVEPVGLGFPSATLVQRHVRTFRIAGVELARPADLLLRILDHLVPLRDPADRP